MPVTHPLSPYIGRFAPSPTGPLHSGSLVAALASFLDARNHQGKWLVRIENTDPPREQPGASDEILKALDAHQLHWDDQVTYQSQRTELYQDAVATLLDQQLAFYCTCSRQQLINHPVYPGTCRACQQPPATPAAIRVLCQPVNIIFDDRIQGKQSHHMAQEIGDFVIYRKDHLSAYQLATAVDDAVQGITHVMRGCDLLDSTPRQIYLQRLLKQPSAIYAHIPVLAKSDGQKLSKQNLATPLNLDACNNNLLQALTFLEQQPPGSLINARCTDILDWAIQHWQPQNIPCVSLIKRQQPDF